MIPHTVPLNLLGLIQKSQLGIVKCKQRVPEMMYWPGMNYQIKQLVKDCKNCVPFENSQPPEFLKPTPVSDLLNVGVILT